jgi:hypothetical protein
MVSSSSLSGAVADEIFAFSLSSFFVQFYACTPTIARFLLADRYLRWHARTRSHSCRATCTSHRAREPSIYSLAFSLTCEFDAAARSTATITSHQHHQQTRACTTHSGTYNSWTYSISRDCMLLDYRARTPAVRSAFKRYEKDLVKIPSRHRLRDQIRG